MGSGLSSPHTSSPAFEDQHAEERDTERGAARYAVGVAPTIEPPTQLVLGAAAGGAGGHPTPERIAGARQRKRDVAHVDAHGFGPNGPHLGAGHHELRGAVELDDRDADCDHRHGRGPLEERRQAPPTESSRIRHRNPEEVGRSRPGTTTAPSTSGRPPDNTGTVIVGLVPGCATRCVAGSSGRLISRIPCVEREYDVQSGRRHAKIGHYQRILSYRRNGTVRRRMSPQ